MFGVSALFFALFRFIRHVMRAAGVGGRAIHCVQVLGRAVQQEDRVAEYGGVGARAQQDSGNDCFDIHDCGGCLGSHRLCLHNCDLQRNCCYALQHEQVLPPITAERDVADVYDVKIMKASVMMV
jgi:hypothetical protein